MSGFLSMGFIRRCSLQSVQYETTPNGFTSPPKGWNSFALQAVRQLTYDQQHVQEQCDYMSDYLGSSGYQYCSLDSGWSVGDHGDDYGRIIFDPSHSISMLLQSVEEWKEAEKLREVSFSHPILV